MKRTVAFLTTFLLLLYGLTWLADTLRAKGQQLDFWPTLQALPGFRPTAQQLDPAPQLDQQQQRALHQLDSLAALLDAQESVNYDSLRADSLANLVPTIPDGIPLIPLEIPGQAEAKLLQFFHRLANAKAQGHTLRILHFGDSQIEGDRISSFLRTRLQREFGGAGVGLVGLDPQVYPPYGLKYEQSLGWTTLHMMPATKREKDLQYGILGHVSILGQQHPAPDTASCQALLTLSRRWRAGRAMQFSKARFFARVERGDLQVLASAGDSLLYQGLFPSDPTLTTFAFNVKHPIDTFRVDFKTSGCALLYGLSLENGPGVLLDNIPLRGSSGTDFMAMGPELLPQMLQALRPSLVLLQFGANVVPGKLDNYDYYQALLTKQLRYLQRLMPEAVLLVLGTSDMAEKVGTHFRSYPNMEMVSQAERQAAQAASAIFWDSRQAMGGQNSIVAWVQANPPLATPDYVHFTPRGARYMAEMFYAALMQAYRQAVPSHQ